MPFLPKPGDRDAGLRVERDHLVAGRDVDDARCSRPSGQYDEAAARQLPRRRLAALAFVLAVHPQHLAGAGVERDDRAARAGGRVDDAVDHQRRRLEVELGTRAERVGLEPPRDFELVEVVFVDLIERRIAGAGEIAAVGGPLAGFASTGRTRRHIAPARGRRRPIRTAMTRRSSLNHGRHHIPVRAGSYRLPSPRARGQRSMSGVVADRGPRAAAHRGSRSAAQPTRVRGGDLEDLEWLGFVPDGPAVRQSERGDIYSQALETLQRQQLVYGCDCSRAEIARAGLEACAQCTPSETLSAVRAAEDELRYPGTCRDRGQPRRAGRRVAGALRAVRASVSSTSGTDRRNSVRPSSAAICSIRDRDGNWTYQFAATVDDYVQGVTHVIRGDDLLASTGRQLQLARLLGRREPPLFLHHALIMKSADAKAVEVGRRHRRARPARAGLDTGAGHRPSARAGGENGTELTERTGSHGETE